MQSDRQLPLRFILLAFIGVFFLAQSAEADDRVFIDVKTKQSEKFDLLPLKIAVSIFLLQSDWALVCEVGEDYSLWMRNYHRERINDEIFISLDVEIRTAALIRSGILLSKERITVPIKAREDWTDVNSIRDAIEKQIENTSKEIQDEAVIIGEEVVKVAHKLIRKLQ